MKKLTLAVITAVLLLAARPLLADPPPASQVGAIIVIAMENHNFVQPASQTSPQQIFGNPAAPFINRLITPGDPLAAQVSFAVSYHNAGVGVHPSEPNYVWAEAGSNFNDHTDADPRAANNNIFTVPHLTGQLDAAGISWKNYQEDVQLSVSPLTSASGTTGPVNPFYKTTQFNYAVKHNPMAFFSDTALENVFPLSQFFDDLASNGLAAYNWVTPNQFDDAHSALSGGFTYHGTHFTGDQAAIATGDNFLSQVIPVIMASPAYQNNGVIVIWWDESEGGDDPSRTIPEIVISPLAKGNAFASAVEMNHSSDVKTMEEIFGLPFLNNPIPAAETNAFGTGFNDVAIVDDLSDLFVPGAIPAPPSFEVTRAPAILNAQKQTVSQVVHIANNGTSAVPGPLDLVLDNLSPNATLVSPAPAGVSAVLAPLGSPFVTVDVGGDRILRPHETKTVKLEFADPSGAPGAPGVSYDTRVLSVTPSP